MRRFILLFAIGTTSVCGCTRSSSGTAQPARDSGAPADVEVCVYMLGPVREIRCPVNSPTPCPSGDCNTCTCHPGAVISCTRLLCE